MALVVLFHVRARLAAGGFVGVDVFFVISGFLMTKIIVERLLAERFSYWGFLKARAARIWPALGGLVVVLTLAGMLLLPPSDLLQLARQALWAEMFLSNGYFLSHAGYAAFAPEGNWFLHTWSLSVEWQFYLLYPLLVWLVVRLARRAPGAPPPLAPARWMLLGLFALSLAAYLWRCQTDPDAAFFGLAYRAWQMLAGGLVYLWIAHGQDLPAAPGIVIRAKGQARGVMAARLRALASYGGLGILVLGALWMGYRHLEPVGLGLPSLLPVLGTGLVLAGADRRNPLLNNPPLQALGRWSYSIYLWHWPLVVICAMDAVLEQHPVGGRLGVIALSVLLGAASYRWIESAGARRPTPGIARYRALALLLAAALVTCLSLATDGLKFRARTVDDASINKPALESDYFPGSCSNFRKPIAEVHPCVIERGARRVLIIGDSLAEHFYPWFKAHSIASVDFLTESECPPVPNFDRLQNGFHCMDYADLAWREAASERYDTVILSANWLMVGVVGPAYCHRDPSGDCRRVQNGPQRTQLVLAELRQAIMTLLAAHKTVVFMDPTPAAPVSVPPRLAREQLWFGEPRFSISAARVDQDNAWIEGMLSSLQSEPGFHLVSMRPAFCDAQRCATYDPALKRPIFVDERHFDPLWVRDHATVFAPFSGAERPGP